MDALSRGASHVTFVDRSAFCVQAIEANLESLSLSTLDPSPFTVLRAEALTAIRRLGRSKSSCDLVFLDPPYGRHLARKSLNDLMQYAIVPMAGLVVAESDKRDPLPVQVEGKEGRLVLQRRCRYGDTALTIYQRQ
jgi:16S rRNA G966 N2-methylase RsmD